jgi:hypothetical protein
VGDTSGNGHHGAFGTTAPSWAAEGLSFSSVQAAVNLPGAAAGSITQSVTFAAVIQMSAAGNFPYLFGGSPQDQGLVLLMSGGTRQPLLYCQTTSSAFSTLSPTPLALNTWYSIVGTRVYNNTAGSGRMDLYVNGALVNFSGGSGLARTAITTLRLGWGSAAGTATLIGSMALAETYSAALSAADVASLHAAYQSDLASRGITL